MSKYLSKLDPGQVLKKSFNDVTERLKVELDGFSISIDHSSDSIRIGDGSSLVGTTTVGSEVGLNAVIIGGVVSGNFQATGLSTGFRTQSVLVGDTPTKVPPAALMNRNGISVRVIGSEEVFFGTSNVTVNNGYPKKQFEEIILDVKDNSAVELYAVVAPGKSCEVRVMEIA